jgi:Fe-S-cluster containining protein
MGDRQEPPEDCMCCGACCFSESIRHARVTGDDYTRLGDDAEGLVTWIENTAFMRLEPVSAPAERAARGSGGLQRCTALAIDPIAGTFVCSIYERRPQVCRDLERAASACRGELTTKGDRPPRALLLLRSLTSRDRTYR